MLMPPFTLHHPNTVDEAVGIASQLLEQQEDFDWVAGGTDVVPNYKWRINPKPHVISLANIPEANQISQYEIGCMTKLSQLTTENKVHPLIVEAASKIASSLVRKSATVGGNLCLDTRCFWYNQSEDWRRSIDWCHKADCGTGADCRVIPNQNTLCVATYQGDLAPNFMALGAKVSLIGPDGERTILLEDFYQLDGMKKNVLQPGEFMLKVSLPADAFEYDGSYQKLRLRESWDFPEAGISAVWKKGDYSTLKIASTALESIPKTHDSQVGEFASSWQNGTTISQLSDAIRKSVKPVNNTALPPNYRKSVVRILTKRALKNIGCE
tara:strand:- start:5858 stop:6832 length:975 start_codon:yes stop_codon:yes gene_type:complete